MATGQNILTRKTASAVFLVLTVNEGGEGAVRDALTNLAATIRTVGTRTAGETLTAIVGIGSDVWDRLFTGPRPAELAPFTELEGSVHTAPSTPGDLLLHIKADRLDLAFEVGRQWTDQLGDAVTTVDEVHGFRYFDMRDVTGFVDGTENPEGEDAAAAILVDDDPGFDGGSYVAIQRYVTDMAKWDATPVAEQENVFGRSKFENIEMPDDVKPSNSHIALNSITDDQGEDLEVVRDNMPYGDVSGSGVKGTFYIAYSKTPYVTDEMLRRMFLGEPEGNYDRLLDFTTAETGVQFYVPTADFLEDLPPAPASTAPDLDAGAEPESADDADPAPAGDGSLGIGSLRRPPGR